MEASRSKPQSMCSLFRFKGSLLVLVKSVIITFPTGSRPGVCVLGGPSNMTTGINHCWKRAKSLFPGKIHIFLGGVSDKIAWRFYLGLINALP